VRRLAPRPLRRALEEVTRQATPLGTLARVQACWEEVAGPDLAAQAEPVSERDGVVTVRCASGMWAQELELLGADLEGRLAEALGGRSEVRSLRFVVGSSPAPGE
jgi:predicted nucleic acid-binding Zn ribbon protein